MKLFRLIPLLCFILLIVSGCGNDKKFTVIVDMKNMPEQHVRLQQLGINDKIVVIDSTETNSTGHFELSGEASEPGLYQLIFERENRYILLSLDKGNVKINGDWRQFQNYNVSGSPSSKSLQSFLQSVSQHMRDLRTISIVMDSMRRTGNDSMLTSATQEAKGITESLTTYVEKYADTTIYLPNALFSIRMLNPVSEEPFIKGFISGLDRRFPKAPQAKEFTDRYEQMMALQKAGPQQPENFTGSSIVNGAQAPEIALNTPEGKQVKLSSLRGQYVLVDFWASWCGPCRMENPNVVAAYNKYKDKGFTILGVSLDDNKDKWVEAIKKDGLTWTHVSDLKKWESIAARDYKVESIPTNFLIDKEGKVVAHDLRGPALEAKLAAVLK